MSIHLSFDTGNISSEEADGLTALIGAIRPSLPTAKELAKRYNDPVYGAQTATGFGAAPAQPPVDNAHVVEGAAQFTEEDVAVNAPKRERGQPSPGKSRRTKAEIAEDEAADAADAAAAEASNIRSGVEDREDPDVVNGEDVMNESVGPDDEANAEQDAADEAAEVAAERQPDAPLSIDDVKALATEYQARYGMAAVQEDGKLIFKEALGNPPEGNDFWRFSLVPTDQPTLKKLTATWQRAIDENPLKRERV